MTSRANVQASVAGSAATSRRQVSALFKHVPWPSHARNPPPTINVDVGGGKYDDGTKYLNSIGVRNLVWDPYNRSPENNARVVVTASTDVPDTATMANVLNVIRRPEDRRHALVNARAFLPPRRGTLYINVWEGNKSGKAATTRDGWQENRRLETYLSEVQDVFPLAKIVKDGSFKMIVAPKE